MNITELLDKVREMRPLVHQITNIVTAGDCASATLSAGGLPVMSQAPEEVEEMTAHADALVLNTGTMTTIQLEAMLLAGKTANKLGLPVILDPVGAGATTLRTISTRRLLKELHFAVIKGNAAEIAVLSGGKASIKGVESVGVDGDLAIMASRLAADNNTVVAVTGAIDLVTDGRQFMELANGHPLMGKVVGTGCMAASLLGCYAAVCADYLRAAVAALTIFGIAAELAAKKDKTPAAFKNRLFDELYILDAAIVEETKQIKGKVC